MIFTVVRWHDSASAWLLVGGLLYVVSTFLGTIVFNVPLNDALAAIDPDNAGASLCGTTISRAGRVEPPQDNQFTCRDRITHDCAISAAKTYSLNARRD